MIVKVTCLQIVGGVGGPLSLLNDIRRKIQEAGGDEAITVETAPREVTHTKRGAILTVYGDSLELLLNSIGDHLKTALLNGGSVTVRDGGLELVVRLERDA